MTDGSKIENAAWLRLLVVLNGLIAAFLLGAAVGATLEQRAATWFGGASPAEREFHFHFERGPQTFQAPHLPEIEPPRLLDIEPPQLPPEPAPARLRTSLPTRRHFPGNGDPSR